jgi:hypothetical protein
MSAPQGYFQTPSPVCLSSPFTVIAGSSGIPQYDLLAYPFRKPILVEEIRFDLLLTDPDVLSKLSLGSFVYVQLQLGQHYLMRDPVPVWLLATFMAQSQEEGRDAEEAAPVDVSSYRWRLPQPLYVESGQVLRATFSREQDGLDSISGFVTYAGRTVSPNEPRPSVIPVPYAAPFVTTAGQVYQQSNERHLFNPFDKDLHVQRMTARISINGLMARNITPSPNNTIGEQQVTVQLDDSWGGKICVERTGPSDVWDVSRASWTFDTVMPAKGMYLVKVWALLPLVFQGNQRLHVAMVGHRMEAL